MALGAMPRLRQSRTSRSRWVSSTRGALGARSTGVAVDPNAEAATSMPPLRARRSTSSISGNEPFLGTKADAPACVARSTHCGSRCAVTTTMTSSGMTSRSRRVAASPS